MLVYIPQSEFVSHIVMFILRICPGSLYFCSAERRVSMIVECGLAVWVVASLDVDGRIARAGDVVAVEATFELAFAEGRDGRGGRVID